ncbi:MAG: heterodisulfide reductase-related iron-sulfur binding cluster [bacterium]|nr:Fe-S oxidoreductase [Gammaproteobacteria bacterium]HIL97858.1 Fe-S oxidoreductase [Pseudomonadales bacterium]
MSKREGSLEAPTRHPINWQNDQYWDEDELFSELERVYNICHGCRRCVSLCDSFPTLFELVDESDTMEVDGVDRADYYQVVDQCYLCDLCYMTKCPYVPPHEWNVDFPHLMLQAKAQRYRKQGASFRDEVLTSTDRVGKLATIPLVDITVNALNNNSLFRKAFESTLGVHHQAPIPEYHSKTLRKTFTNHQIKPKPAGVTTGKVAFYATCYGNYNVPVLGRDFVSVFEHNGIQIDLVPKEACCGMPKLELGDLQAVNKLKEKNIPVLAKLVDEGYDLIAPIPSCVLMYKQELPLMYPEDADVIKVQKAFFDPFEYLFLRHKQGEFNTEFADSLGEVSYQVACHLRVQNIGFKTRDILKLIPDTTVTTIERCSGHDGTYAVKQETREKSLKIARAVVRQVDKQQPQHFTSDCPMAATQIENLTDAVEGSEHPISLLRKAYGL